MSEPYLSVVATARNDNHGGDLLARMQVFINGLAAQCERHRLETELILVEWNPPADRSRLADALDLPENEWFSTRIIEVPHALHATLEHSDRLPLFQMIAKNVGIRRARGEFVLATNVDVLFPDELMAFLARRELERDKLYRVDRHDVAIEADPGVPIDETLRRCPENVVRICSRAGSKDLVTGKFYRVYYHDRLPLFVRRVLTFWRAVYARLYRFVAYFDALGKRWAARYRRFTASHLGREMPPGPAPEPFSLRETIRATLAYLTPTHIWQAFAHQVYLARTAWEGEAARIPLHTNASGDFTLLPREGWEATLAYPELELFSMHLDGLFLYQAHYAGFHEVDLSQPIYHIEHSAGFKPTPSAVKTLNDRLSVAAIPQITNHQFMSWITTMYRTRQPIAFNGEDWGFASVTLREPELHPQLEEASI